VVELQDLLPQVQVALVLILPTLYWAMCIVAQAGAGVEVLHQAHALLVAREASPEVEGAELDPVLLIQVLAEPVVVVAYLSFVTEELWAH